MNLGAGDRPEQVKTLQVSSGFFQVFGVARRRDAPSLLPKMCRTVPRWLC
jgi:hypothetical protein